MTTRCTSASNLSDLMRRDSSSGVGKSDKRAYGLGSIPSGADWQDVVTQITTLFQTKKMSMKLYELINKVKTVKSDMGNLINDFYKESILKKGMIILREEVREKNGDYLEKLANCWTAFFCNILPTLQAVFASLPQANGLAVREVSLVYFRDIVVLKTKLDEIIHEGREVPPRIVQMLLVLQSVHDSNVENYQKLEALIAKTVNPYLSTSVLQNIKRKTATVCAPLESNITEQLHQTKSFMVGNERLDPVIEVDVGSQRSSISSLSNETMTPATALLVPPNSESGYSQSNP